MAKRRNATALFEVMAAHRARQQAREHGGPTPVAPADDPSAKPADRPSLVEAGRRWLIARLEGRGRDEAAAVEADEPAPSPSPSPQVRAQRPARQPVAQIPLPALDPSDPTAGMTAQSLSARAPSAAAGPVTYTTVMPTYGRSRGEEPAGGASRADPRRAAQASIDRGGQQVSLKVRYKTVGIGAAATVVVLGTAYLAGKGTAGPAPDDATQTVKKQAGVLDVQKPVRAAGKAGDPTLAGHRAAAAGTGRDARADAQPSGPAGGTVVAPAAAPFVDAHIINNKARRTPGLNYCVVASYGPDLEAVALEVSGFLNDNGVPNTVEFCPNKETWKADGFLVVGVRGFGRGYMSSAEYRQYMQGLRDAAARFPQKSKFGRLREMMVKLEG